MENRKPITHILISLTLLAAITGHELFKPDAYIPIKGDVPTIGIGTTVYPDGTKVELGDKITRAQADEYLKGDLDKFKQGMMKCIKAPLYEHEFNAYLSLTYNIGAPAFCNSTIPYKLNHGQYKEACTTILAFNKMRDVSKPKVRNPKTGQMQWQLKVVRGLDNRRKMEYNMCINSTGAST